MPSTNTITAFYSFSTLTVIKSAEFNNNFNVFRGSLLPVSPNTQTLDSTGSYNVGSSEYIWNLGFYKSINLTQYDTTTSVPTPASGTNNIYFKSNGSPYFKTSGDVESQIATLGDLGAAAITSTAADYSITANDFIVVVDASATTTVSVVVPTAVNNTGGTYFIKKDDDDTSDNEVRLSFTAGETASVFYFKRTGGFIHIVSDGTKYQVRDRRVGTNLIELSSDMGSWEINTTWTTWYQVKECGTKVDIQYFVNTLGAPDSTTLYADLPSDLSLNYSELINTTSPFATKLGEVTMRDSSASFVYPLSAIFFHTGSTTTSNADLFQPLYEGTAGRLFSITQTAPHTWGSGDYLHLVLKDLPITGY